MHRSMYRFLLCSTEHCPPLGPLPCSPWINGSSGQGHRWPLSDWLKTYWNFENLVIFLSQKICKEASWWCTGYWYSQFLPKIKIRDYIWIKDKREKQSRKPIIKTVFRFSWFKICFWAVDLKRTELCRIQGLSLQTTSSSIPHPQTGSSPCKPVAGS